MTDELTIKTVEEGHHPAYADPMRTAAIFRSMVGRKIASVALKRDRTEITFFFSDGHVRTFQVEAGCCSSSWIEHLEMPSYVVGATIIYVQDGGEVTQNHDDHDHDLERIHSSGNASILVYNTLIQTDLGDIVLEYRNASNGYYGGSLTFSNERMGHRSDRKEMNEPSKVPRRHRRPAGEKRLHRLERQMGGRSHPRARQELPRRSRRNFPKNRLRHR